MSLQTFLEMFALLTGSIRLVMQVISVQESVVRLKESGLGVGPVIVRRSVYLSVSILHNVFVIVRFRNTEFGFFVLSPVVALRF